MEHLPIFTIVFTVALLVGGLIWPHIRSKRTTRLDIADYLARERKRSRKLR